MQHCAWKPAFSDLVAIMVLAVSGDNGYTPLEEMLMTLVKANYCRISLWHSLFKHFCLIQRWGKSNWCVAAWDYHWWCTSYSSTILEIIPEKRAEIMWIMLNDMLKKNLISPSNSLWAAPIVLVKQRDGTCHFYVDYHQVNGMNQRDMYPLLWGEDILETLATLLYYCLVL